MAGFTRSLSVQRTTISPIFRQRNRIPRSRVTLNEKYGEGDTMAREHEQLKGVTDKAGGAIKDGANKQAKKQAGPNLRGRLVHRATIRST
jgi:hypothetical protein